MRLLFIRHGDPDYEHDSLTEKGVREAECLGKFLKRERLDAVYVSPLGRAKKTAEIALAGRGDQRETLDWLREFAVPIAMPKTGEKHWIWDFYPSFLQEYPQLYSQEDWLSLPFIEQSSVPKQYKLVCDGVDTLLARHGYERVGNRYQAVQANRDTIAFFCHFGVTGVILSHLFNLAPVPLLQHFVAAPTSVTTVYTEEREEGIVSFRCARYGDVSHLVLSNEPVSFAARFCETFDDFSERH